MIPSFCIAVVWLWWYSHGIGLNFYGKSMRETSCMDEKTHTHNRKSSNRFTLTFNCLFFLLCSGGTRVGWVMVCATAMGGWDLWWVGLFAAIQMSWGWESLGWAGDIRERWVVIIGSLSRCYMVACFSSHLWSIGFCFFLYTHLNLRLTLRGHQRGVVSGVSGIDLYLRVIREDQLGGSSFRCNPFCFPTPTLETHVGIRNLVFTDIYSVGLGWRGGWDRTVASQLRWSKYFHSYPEGIWVNLGWYNLFSLMLMDLSFGFTYMEGAKSWLHQSGRSWRIKIMHNKSSWLRGIFVLKGWDSLYSLHCDLVWKSQLWDYTRQVKKGILVIPGWVRYSLGLLQVLCDLIRLSCLICGSDKGLDQRSGHQELLSKIWDFLRLVKKNGSSRSSPRYQHNAVKSWTCNWARVFWKDHKLCNKYSQPIRCSSILQMLVKLDILRGCSKGTSVFLGWVRFYPGLLGDFWGLIRLSCILRGCCKCPVLMFVLLFYCRGNIINCVDSILNRFFRSCCVNLGLVASISGLMVSNPGFLWWGWGYGMVAWASLVTCYGSMDRGHNYLLKAQSGMGLCLISKGKHGLLYISLAQNFYKKVKPIAPLVDADLGHLDRVQTQWICFKLKAQWWVCKVLAKLTMYGTSGLLCYVLESLVSSWIGVKWARHFIVIFGGLFYSILLYVLYYLKNMRYCILG
ncbi:hypothetical protein Hanom_Chr16g01518101 [Helianthus anomalus]